MNQLKQYSSLNVVSVNPYNETYFNSISNHLNSVSAPSYAKDQNIISILNTQSFINANIQISKNISQEDIADAILSKVYDEIALDQAIEFQIQFIETFNTFDIENRYFNVFIVDPDIIISTYKSITNKIKYIDVIIPSPLLLKSLYSKDIIESNGVHCFIYIQENDAFISIYNDKEFLYTKSIKYSLEQMHERFCELYGEKVDYNEFKNFLSTQNLKHTQSNYKNFIIKLYKELFATVNDILTYLKRAFDIRNIEHIYIGMDIPSLSKLDEMIEAELNIKASDFNFSYGFDSHENFIGQMHPLMQIYATLPLEDKYDTNFTMFHRPSRFAKRESGKLIIAIVASLVIAFAYPVAYWILTYGQILQYNLLTNEYAELYNQKTTREEIIKNKEIEKQNAIALLKKEKKQYIEKKNTLIKIHDVKVNYPMKAKLLSILTKDLNSYDVRLESLFYNEQNAQKKIILHLVSEDDKKITELVEHLTKVHKGIFRFSLHEINFKEKDKKYFSELKVELL